MANLSFTKSSLTDQQSWYKATILQKIVVEHWYYRNNQCNDFEFIPTSKTQKILKRYALNIKSVGNEYQIIALKELEDEIIRDMQHEKLEFYIQLKNPYFTNFTALQEKQHPKSYYFFKQEPQGVIQEEVVMVNTIFEWTFDTIESVTELKLHDADDNELKTINLVDNNGSYHVSIDMHPYKTGMYSLTSSDLKIKVFLLKTANIPQFHLFSDC